MNQSYRQQPLLTYPINELLSHVYENTLKRDLQGFATIKTHISPDFTPLEDCPLTVEEAHISPGGFVQRG